MADLYLGTLGGEDWSTVKAMLEWFDANPAGANRTVYITSDVADTVPVNSPIAIKMGAYELNFTIDGDDWHKGDPNAGHVITLGDDCTFQITRGAGDSGPITVEKLRIFKSAGNSTADISALYIYDLGGNPNAYNNYYDLMVRGNRGIGGSGDYGIRGSNRNTGRFDIRRCVVWNCLGTGFYFNWTSGSPGSWYTRTMKNCISYLNDIGFHCDDDGVDMIWHFYNSWACENVTQDFVYYADNIHENCADSDSTLPVAISNQRGITIANEVQSTDITSADFLKLIDGIITISTSTPGSTALGQTGIDSGLTVDIIGNSIPGNDNLYSIGPFEQQHTISSLNLSPPVFLYNGSYINFSTGIYAPSFPAQEGLSLHSYITEKPFYTVTTRKHGTTAFAWQTNGAKQTDRDTIEDFWYTTLTEGYENFTIIDHRKRMLFEASWNDWIERWTKRNGGVYDITYQIESPIPWTLSTFGIYPMVTAALINHNLSGNNLTASNGSYVQNSVDASVLRLNGYALKMEGDGSSSGLLGASGTVEWVRTTKHNHITLFCQFMADAVLQTGNLAILEVAHSSNVFRIGLKENAGANALFGKIVNNADSAEVRKGTSTYHELTSGTWYDLAFTYDAITQKSFLYFAESGDSSFTEFLSGETDITEGIGSTNNQDCTVQDIPWTACNILKELTSDVVGDGNNVYVQNPMVFDGTLSPHDFNTLRRLTFLWNKKTDTYPK